MGAFSRCKGCKVVKVPKEATRVHMDHGQGLALLRLSQHYRWQQGLGSSQRLLVVAERCSDFWQGSLVMSAAKAIAFCIREGAKTHWGRRSGAPAMGKI